MIKNNKRVKYACYVTNLSMAVVSNITPVLFLTFREMYDISYSLLGLLVLVNFCTQLTVDILFSLFSHRINLPFTVKMIPVLTVLGFALFAAAPIIFPNAVYVGLVLGTIVFSASGGFSEVLISPVIAALPSDNPQREMSALHSIYAWGTVGVIIISTLYILLFDARNWQLLVLGFVCVPAVAAVLFYSSALPALETPRRQEGAFCLFKNPALWLCFVAIFLGGAAESVMAQWSSGYIENALAIPKVWGDIFGVALFSVMLGLGRTFYSRYGKHIERVMLLGAIGAFVCYLVAALSPLPVIALLACALTGFAVSMLWPGSLIVGEERVVPGGVVMYAMLAAGGDLGASIGPQLVGIITDAVSENSVVTELAERFAISADQLGMKFGMLVAALFPLAAIFVYLYLVKTKSRRAEVR